MKKVTLKKHYKFTLYQLKFYYFENVKKIYFDYRGNYDDYYDQIKTTINHSCYSKEFSIDFSDENSLKKFLRKRYKDSKFCSFYTDLGKAIKSDNLNSASEWIAIVSTSSAPDKIGFTLKEPKKKNKFYPRRKNRYGDYYKSSYAWMGREIKNKKLEESRNLDY